MTSSNDQKRMPTQTQLSELYALPVLDKNKRQVIFKSLIESGDGKPRRHIIILIRHFFCGQCEDYARALSSSNDFSPEHLGGLEPATKLIFIGCGDPDLISEWQTRTNCPFDTYADPTRQTYDKLDCVVNLGMGDQKPKYITQSTLSNVVSSFWTTIRAGSKILSGGKFSQNGGEFVWIDGELRHVHRMRNTTDHMELEDLYKVLAEQGSAQAHGSTGGGPDGQ